jgi:hypothetical protein
VYVFWHTKQIGVIVTFESSIAGTCEFCIYSFLVYHFMNLMSHSVI